jgi:hypothetical protein
MVSCFLGGAVLSAITSSLYGSAGWSGVCILGGVTGLLALVTWVLTEASAPARAGRKRGLRPVREGAGD